ncbi:unnamed protein product [Didymodactylos carnosus]|uniref:Reverse transcriptase domain-containing protein n=1 Tax=Didymodactylos carnosus TaxID=1234261 RepID=A0A8S2EGF4_9BILA|nr:unnamed protein product [Didymodactylos carnosus]CAF3929957.1 unnamed protein product [Didymodactylos carnosus]
MEIVPKAVPKVHFSPHLDDRVLKKDKLDYLTHIIDAVVDKFRVTTAETLVLIAEVELASIDLEIQELDNSIPPNIESGDNEEPKASDLYKLYYEARQIITQKHVEEMSVDPVTAELAHLYFLPKAHKPNTPLRPLVAGISTYENLKILRPTSSTLFDAMAKGSSITGGIYLVERLRKWAQFKLTNDAIFITIDVSDLYTMVPQKGGLEAILEILKKILEFRVVKLLKLYIQSYGNGQNKNLGLTIII